MKFIEALFRYFKRFYEFIKKPFVKVIIIFIIFVFSGFYLINQFNELSDTLANLKVELPILFIALALIVFTVIMGTLSWWSILSGLDYHRSWVLTAEGYAYSSLAKYIPGFIWQFAGRAFFSEQLSIPLKFIGVGISLELLLTTLIGGLLASLTYLFGGYQNFPENSVVIITVIIITCLLIFLLIKLPGYIEKILQKYLGDVEKLYKRAFYLGELFNFTGWILMSSAYYLIISSFGIKDFPFLSAVFFHTTSFVAGTIALPFPNGLIIREATLILIGQEILGEHILVVSSVIFRIMILIGEGFVTLFLFVFSRLMNKKL